ncbi:4-oxalocrotonate tautomerase family protein [Kitasatospora sp. NPDC091257]|uniref:tautomerase family protein n=1 Tax=Kitasatospora sp. NPDC091257 TaxID=3364084 RepID=UPI003817661A
MPHLSLHIREESLDPEVERALIAGLTEAVTSVFGERVRPLVAVELIGVPQRRRGIGGLPTEEVAPVVLLSLREAAYHLPQVPDAPARLVAAATAAITGALGEVVGRQTVVTLDGVPAGRSGIGGRVA